MTGHRIVVAAALLLAGGAVAVANESFDAKTAFEALKKLEGSWEGASPEGPVSVTYKVTAAGSAVAETLFPGTPHEMITMYFLDGDKLRLTHYCAAGNQPRMVLKNAKSPAEMSFVFDGATNMKSDRDMHMHEAVIRVLGPDHLQTDWTHYKDGVKAGTVTFDVQRKK